MINDEPKERYAPRYDWRETVDCEGMQDYCSWDDGVQFGRILKDSINYQRKGYWRWAMNYIPWQRQYLTSHNGWEPKMRDAIQKVEEHYEMLKQLHGR
jgi:hypothetical protein